MAEESDSLLPTSFAIERGLSVLDCRTPALLLLAISSGVWSAGAGPGDISQPRFP